ncbi:hypothetical protein [Hymenobacter ruber]
MKTLKKAPRTVLLYEDAEHEPGTADLLYHDEQPPEYGTDAADPLCSICGDPLAWHEQACAAAPTPPAAAEHADNAPPVPLYAPGHAFAFAIGNCVQPTHSAPAPVIWRGQHKERHPATGLYHRVNVYRLDNGYWDCYREDELQAA